LVGELLYNTEPADGDAFARRHNISGVGVFDCVSLLAEGATRRSKETVGEVDKLCGDIDLKDVVESADEIIRRLETSLLPPSVIILSGHGVHAKYVLKTSITDPTKVAEAEQILRKLTEHICGDPAVAHFAALLRRPGTINSKDNDDPRLCEVVRDTRATYELEDIAAWLELVGDAPLFTRKEKPPASSRGIAVPDDVTAGPIDVTTRLADMSFEGPGDRSIHLTQLVTSASMLRAGKTVDETTAIILEATKNAVAGNPRCASWDWAKEEVTIKQMCFDLISKAMRNDGEDLAYLLPDHLAHDWDLAIAAGKIPKIIHRWDHGFHVRAYGRPQLVGAAATVEQEAAAIWTPGGGQWTTGNGKDHRADDAKHGSTDARGAKVRRFRLVAFKDLRPGPEPLYTVHELLPVGGVVLFWGKPKCLKSFFTLDLMFHIANGWDYRERSVQGGPVIYFAFEGGHGYKKRVEGLRRHYGIPDHQHVPMYIVSGHATLVRDVRVMITEVRDQLKELGEGTPRAVVLDTLNRSIGGSENKDVDMNGYINAADAISAALGCVVIVVHHCGWDDSRPRGHSSLPGAVAAQLSIEREGDFSAATVEFMRDGPEDIIVNSRIERIVVGHDQTGKELSTLVLLPTEAPAQTQRKKAWPKALVVFRDALASALDSHRVETSETGDPTMPRVWAVDLEHVRDEFFATYPVDGDTEDQRQETRSKQFRRCVKRAQAEGLIKVRASPEVDLVWPVPGTDWK